MTSTKADNSSVRVACRIRPLSSHDLVQGHTESAFVTPNEPQIVLCDAKAFTYDYAFNTLTEQSEIYNQCVQSLVDGLFDGYNATVLAYGQTGSGKTYTMGTNAISNNMERDMGIIPRAVEAIFNRISSSPNTFKFEIKVQFVELYNEEIIDLLDFKRLAGGVKKNVRIHENGDEIYLTNVEQVTVDSLEATLDSLKDGALSRTTAATAMNSQSSRSHAIFTLIMRQMRSSTFSNASNEDTSDIEQLNAKFHFVDLAGSERLKRTGATGDRAREGISINSGLLALGNVISTLGDPNRKPTAHVPYRDSKLTRLLQDSLGGNSKTLMMACISPADVDIMETCSTLKYADRARQIKNKVHVNQDKSSKIITDLRSRIHQLEVELIEWRQGKREAGGEFNDQYHENVLLNEELNNLRTRCSALKDTNDHLSAQISSMKTNSEVQRILSQHSHDSEESEVNAVNAAIRDYIKEIEDLRSSLIEVEEEKQRLRNQNHNLRNRMAQNDCSPIKSFTTSMMNSSENDENRPDNLLLPQGAQIYKESSLVVARERAEIEKLKERMRQQEAQLAQQEPHKRRKIRQTPATSPEFELNSCISDVEMQASTSSDYVSCSVTTDNNEDDCGDAMSSRWNTEDDDDYGEDLTVNEEEKEKLEQETAESRRNLAYLQEEIGSRERLLDALQLSEQRFAAQRAMYELKLTNLGDSIKAVQNERDCILREKVKEKASKDETSQIEKKYQARLEKLNKELRRYEMLEKSHRETEAKRKSDKEAINKLINEVGQMRKAKVQLQQRICEEVKRGQEMEKKRARELNQLRNEKKKGETRIRQLENEQRAKEQNLQRKQNEIQRLKREKQMMLDKRQYARRQPIDANLTPISSKWAARNKQQLPFSLNHARKQWTMLEQSIDAQVVKQRQVDEVSRQLDRLTQRRADVQLLIQQTDLGDERDEYQMQINHLNRQIRLKEVELLQIDDLNPEPKNLNHEITDGVDTYSPALNANAGLDCKSLEEAKYLIDHLVSFCVEQSVRVAQTEMQLRDVKVQENPSIQSQLLPLLIQERLNETFALSAADDEQTLTASSLQKIRRRTQTPHEILYGTQLKNMTQRMCRRPPFDHFGAEESDVDDRTIIINPRPHSKSPTPPIIDSTTRNVSPIRADEPLTMASIDKRGSSVSILSQQATDQSLIRADSWRQSLRKPLSPQLKKFNTNTQSDIKSLAEDNILSPQKTSNLCHNDSVKSSSQQKVDSMRNTVVHDRTQLEEAINCNKTTQCGILTPIKDCYQNINRIVSIDSNDDRFVAGGKDHAFFVFDIERQTVIHSFDKHRAQIQSVRIAPNNNDHVFVASFGVVREFDLRVGDCVRAFSSNGQLSKNIDGWKTNRCDYIKNERTVLDARLTKDGKYLALTGGQFCRVFDVDSGQNVMKALDCCKYTPKEQDRSYPLNASYLNIIEKENGAFDMITGSQDYLLSQFSFLPNGKREQTAFSRVCLRKDSTKYDCCKKLVIDSYFEKANNVNFVFVVDNDQILYTYYYKSDSDLKLLKTSILPDSSSPTAFTSLCTLPIDNDLSPPLLLIGDNMGSIRCWDNPAYNAMLTEQQLVKAHDDAINEMSYNGRLLFTASKSMNNAIRLFHVKNPLI